MKILLIHGLGRTPFSMRGIGQALGRAGHHPEFFGYTTLLSSFDEIVSKLRDHIQTLSAKAPYGVVTHSMGAILLRAALNDASFVLPAHAVMLAPPNQSPRLARVACQLPPFRWFAGQSGENLASPAFYANLATLSCPYTIITGNIGLTGSLSPFGAEVNDLIVGAEESKMHPHDSLVEVPSPHSFIMNNKIAQEMTVKAFATI